MGNEGEGIQTKDLMFQGKDTCVKKIKAGRERTIESLYNLNYPQIITCTKVRISYDSMED